MDIVSSFRNFIHEFMDQEGREAYLEQVRRMTTEGKRSLLVDYADLLRYDPELAEELISRPDEVITDAEKALWEALRVQDADFAEKAGMVHVRIINSYQSTLVPMRGIRAEHIARLIAIDGIVTRATEIKPLLTQAWFRCLAEACGHEFVRFQEEGRYNPPVTCPNPECNRKGPFKLLTERSTFVDWQRITIQEKPEALPPGQMPQSFSVVLRDDLVDSVRPGDRALVTGVLHSYPEKMLKRGQLATYTRVLEGVACEKETEQYEKLEISPEDEENILDLAKDPIIDKKIVQSIAPSIHGYEVVKEAIACLLFGGAGKETPDGMRIRGDVNILLVGDPGVGKCLTPYSEVVLANGERVTIRDLIDKNITRKSLVSDGFYEEKETQLLVMGTNGRIREATSNIQWKRKSPKKLVLVRTLSGRQTTVTPTHPFFCCKNGYIKAIQAKDLTKDDFVAVPRKIEVEGNNALSISYQRSRANNAVRLNPPKEITPWFAAFLGLFIAEGYSQDKGNSKLIWFTNSDEQLLQRYKSYLKKMGVNYGQRRSSNNTAEEIYCGSSELYNFLKKLEPKLVKKSHHKRIPNQLMRATEDVVKEFLIALFDGEAHIAKDRPKIELASASYDLLKDTQLLLSRFEIISHVKKKVLDKGTYYRLHITGLDELRKFNEYLGFTISYKRQRLELHVISKKKANINVDIIPNVSGLIKRMRKDAQWTQFDFSIPRSTYQHYERGDRNPSRENLRALAMDYEQRGINGKDFGILKTISSTDIYWDKIEEIKEIPSDTDWVYDLQIPEFHNFIADGFFVHNSQVLKSIADLAPRGLYTSGRGSSAAGLTAAVLRDADSGEMSLEAGALVLADEGLAAIDEFDKMRSEDRSAIHEALEQHTVSIAKAGIVATLNARASVLAAANPREGRWDPWKDPAYNINLPPTLLSRFDLIFPLQDQPDEVEDERKSEHILKIHRSRSLETEPPLSTDLLKKYISYARQRPPPTLSADAIDRLQKFYLELRKRAVVSEKGAEPIPVPITPRQLEALIRLAEARARMELREEVLPEDAVAAIRLLTATMEALAVDIDTGIWDSDRATTGISTKTRSRQGRLRVIIDKLADEYGTFSFQQILQRAQKDIPGLQESELLDFVEFLKREGKLYEPQTEQYRKPR